ncbi:MAG: hypothetical protein KY391_08260 [Actinobacteria bacterium]|nr:hypothetical protein [Actinomycetota bacterium]
MGERTPRIDDEIQRTWRQGETTASPTALADPDTTDSDDDSTDADSDTTDSSDADTTDS